MFENGWLYSFFFANLTVSEAQIRFLKAKLRVMQEEMDRLSAELGSKVWNIDDFDCRIKDFAIPKDLSLK
jgi:hypothetical protein